MLLESCVRLEIEQKMTFQLETGYIIYGDFVYESLC